ncbi:hypothetical protein [Sphingopyxis macrogoltabida]|uniref:hypothetical protein n=1 Tax=Sphingopyxis macrogoltabida TaxID=33050 RepID=UPI0012E0D3D7|nr:hypothetical protein [Sphingopyxis macrogoltabida]
MPKRFSGAIGLLAGALVVVLLFGATLKNVAPVLAAASLLIGYSLIELLIERSKRKRNG